jgi:tetratricopeptide (TPR) repeat protein
MTTTLPRKKIYAHYSGSRLASDSDELTKILWVQPDTTVAEILEDFINAAGFSANPKTFAILSPSGEALKSGSIYERVDHKDDCIVQDLIILEGPSKKSTEQVRSPAVSTPAALAEIDNFIKNRQFRKARLACEEILKGSPSDFAALERLTLVLFSSKHFQEAVPIGEKAVSLESKESTRQIYLTLGRSLLENQDHEEAYHVFQRGIELFEKRPKTTAEGKTLYLNLKAERCRALFLLGRHPEAGAAINDLMTSSNPYGADPQSNVAALIMYAEIAAQYDKVSQEILSIPLILPSPRSLRPFKPRSKPWRQTKPTDERKNFWRLSCPTPPDWTSSTNKFLHPQPLPQLTLSWRWQSKITQPWVRRSVS